MRERFMRRVYGSISATSPRSKSALCQKRLYKTCIVVCSAPPEYRSTGIQFAIFFASANFFLFFGSTYRKKYHDESTNVSSVSVSRSALPLHFGHFTCTHFFAFASGDLPRPSGRESFISGSLTGRSLSGTGCAPHFGQWMIGIGTPQ